MVGFEVDKKQDEGGGHEQQLHNLRAEDRSDGGRERGREGEEVLVGSRQRGCRYHG